jgi:hypothetical protein
LPRQEIPSNRRLEGFQSQSCAASSRRDLIGQIDQEIIRTAAAAHSWMVVICGDSLFFQNA